VRVLDCVGVRIDQAVVEIGIRCPAHEGAFPPGVGGVIPPDARFRRCVSR
jgi:hypothetical protein